MTDPLKDDSLWDWVVLARKKVAHQVREDEKGRTLTRCGLIPPGYHNRSTNQDLTIKCWLCQQAPAEQGEMFQEVESA